MTIRKSTLVLALAVSAFTATHASAFFSNERPPPRGLNGASLNGLADQGLAEGNKRGDAEAFPLKGVVLPDGSRIVVK